MTLIDRGANVSLANVGASGPFVVLGTIDGAPCVDVSGIGDSSALTSLQQLVVATVATNPGTNGRRHLLIIYGAIAHDGCKNILSATQLEHSGNTVHDKLYVLGGKQKMITHDNWYVPLPDLVPGSHALQLLPRLLRPRTTVLHIFLYLYPILLIALITNVLLSVVVRRAIYRWCRVYRLSERANTQLNGKEGREKKERERERERLCLLASPPGGVDSFLMPSSLACGACLLAC